MNDQLDEKERYLLDNYFQRLDVFLKIIEANTDRLMKLTVGLSTLMLAGWITLVSLEKSDIVFASAKIACAGHVLFFVLAAIAAWDGMQVGDAGRVFLEKVHPGSNHFLADSVKIAAEQKKIDKRIQQSKWFLRFVFVYYLFSVFSSLGLALEAI